jgi:hypothetical protein
VLSIYEVIGIAMASLVIFLLLRPIGTRLRGLGKVLLRSFVAFFGIWAVNIVGGFFGFHLGLNLERKGTGGRFARSMLRHTLMLAVSQMI